VAATIIDLNRRRHDLHRFGVAQNLLPVLPELFPEGPIARWRDAAQDAGFEGAKR
jgi:hypothetical protein